MSELINNPSRKKELLKHMILQLHEGDAPDEVRGRLINLMSKVPYGLVVEVEQELIEEGVLDEQAILKFCDLHTEALEGQIDQTGAKEIPAGHPVDVFIQENEALLKIVTELEDKYNELRKTASNDEIPAILLSIRSLFNQLMDVDKHYLRLENLLFPFLEKYGITGPPTVMWGKHDEARELLKGAIEALNVREGITSEEVEVVIDMVLKPASNNVADMTMKEEEILFPMSMDKLTDHEWMEIVEQTSEFGFCLIDPEVEWKPVGVFSIDITKTEKDESIKLPSGNFTIEELTAVLNTLPVDITFVDKNDKVKYFSQAKERIFPRTRAILNRNVRMCHPPSSVHIVEEILQDFKSGKEDQASFWIQMGGQFIHIDYFAMKGSNGEYLGTLEVSQNLTEKRALKGEQRILSYKKNDD
ncbi:MAG: DUF438 domain-containing protein [Bacteroidales bacterium]|nr:DUF438 domain-containing protein [Bacteroidales bacterium]